MQNTLQKDISAEASSIIECGQGEPSVAIPNYLHEVYWWAYVHPNAVRFFEREWLTNLILLGNYNVLRDAAIEELGDGSGRTLQVACAYGNLTPRMAECVAEKGHVDVVDVVAEQLVNLKRKLPDGSPVSLFQRDSSNLGFADSSYDNVLLFFLLHEQPEEVRRKTLQEACRVLKSGGKLIIIEYHCPDRQNLLGRPLRLLLKFLEPFAEDIFKNGVEAYLPEGLKIQRSTWQSYFGGLYQKHVMTISK